MPLRLLSVVVYTVTENPSIQSFDRVISPAARAIVPRVDGEKWRFFITSEQLLKLTIEQKGMLGAFPTKQMYIAKGRQVLVS